MPDIISNHPPEKTYKISLTVEGLESPQNDTEPWTWPEIKGLKNMIANPEKRGSVTITLERTQDGLGPARVFPISRIIAIDYRHIEQEDR